MEMETSVTTLNGPEVGRESPLSEILTRLLNVGKAWSVQGRINGLDIARTISRLDTPRSAVDEIAISALSAFMVARGNTPLRITDIGCGNGAWSETLLALAPKGSQYIGVDLRPHPSESYQHLKAEFIACDAVSWSRSDTGQPNDIVFSHSLLEHVDFDVTIVVNTARSLSTNGIALHIVPGPYAWLAYPMHGRRHYSIGLLLRLSERLQNSHTVTIHCVGGPLTALTWGFLRGAPSLLQKDFDGRRTRLGRLLLNCALRLDTKIRGVGGIFSMIEIRPRELNYQPKHTH